ncbi:hypothetical protein TNCV_1219591 [Trichonephila clavipes]|nr:hypothetical protein TNCV_1219591 [Trichonephila clavipes]
MAAKWSPRTSIEGSRGLGLSLIKYHLDWGSEIMIVFVSVGVLEVTQCIAEDEVLRCSLTSPGSVYSIMMNVSMSGGIKENVRVLLAFDTVCPAPSVML